MKPSNQKPIRDEGDNADNKSNEPGRQPSKRVRKQPRKYEDFHSDEVVLPKTEETAENLETAASPDVEVKEEIEETSSAANESAEKRKRGRPPNRTRDEDRIFCCEVCGKTFRQPGVFRVHKRIHTGEKPYQCEHCGMSFSQVGTLRDHQKIHTGERPYGCDFCPSRFTNKTRLTRHLRTHTGERPYKCDFCQMDFTSKSVLDKHRRVHTGEKPFQCEECGMAFTQRSTFVNHCKAHKGQRKRYPQRLLFYFCKPCSRHYPNVEKLYNHVCIPSGQHPEGTYNCKDCPRKFLSEESLESHMSETHSPEADNTQECVACNARFTNFDEFMEHVMTHGKSAPLPSSSAEPPAAVFTCPECGKECTTKAQLSIHQRIHSGEKPFLCHFCSKTFRYRQNLREHLNSHMGKRPYACDQCNKSFSFSANLSTHKLTHKENKGRCRFCNKSFRSSAKLKAHEDAHSQAEGEDFSELPSDAIATMAVDDDGESYLVLSVEESTFS